MTPERLAELRARYPSLAAVGELAAEIEHLWTAVTIFQQQRDGAWATVRAHAGQIAATARLGLASSPDDHSWQLVAAYARSLLRAAGPPQRPGGRPDGEIQWGIRVHHHDPDGEISTSVMTGYTENGARHRAITGFEHAEPVYRHLGPWLDAPTLPIPNGDPT